MASVRRKRKQRLRFRRAGLRQSGYADSFAFLAPAQGAQAQTLYDAGSAYGARNPRETLIKLCGCTRIAPVRGLSKSAMEKNEMATISGRTKSSLDFFSLCAT